MMSAIAVAGLLAGAAPAVPGVTGVWKTPVDGGGTVRIEACGQAICGRAVSSPRLIAHPDQKDLLNRNPNLRGRLIKGLLLLRLRPVGPSRWGDGWVYDPSNGGTYKGTAELKSDGRLLLKGCIVSPFCQTQTWTRVR